MKAMILKQTCNLSENLLPLEMAVLPDPEPTEDQILIKISACGVCHTELDEIEGRTPPAFFPMILGHEVVGRVILAGKKASRFQIGDRVGISWFFSSCGKCEFCLQGKENLCSEFKATGRDAWGGYAELMAVPEQTAFPLPPRLSDVQAAPLLCAGAIGYRSLRLAEMQDGQILGLTGFGASAHLVLKMMKIKYPASPVFVFARNPAERDFALELGAAWSGDTTGQPPELCHAIIDTTPVWKPVIEALARLRPSGRLVINAIRKENTDLDYFSHLDYAEHIWREKEIKSVANVTRKDVSEFLELAESGNFQPTYQIYPLNEANRALSELKRGIIRGAKVLVIES